MIDLKIKTEQPGVVGEESKKRKTEEYPYGLRITLNKKILKKLGISVDDFEIGEDTAFKVKGKIIQLSKNQNEYDDETRESVEIQITNMNLKPESILVKAQKIIES